MLYKEYGEKVKYWVSLNEQNIFIGLGYVKKLHPPKVSNYQRFLNANHIASLANASAIKLFREMQIPGQIGASFAYSPAYAKSEKPEDVIAMENAQEIDNFLWMDVYGKGEYPQIALKLLENLGLSIDFQEGDKALLKAGICDFMGVNYYQSSTYNDPNQKQETLQAGNAAQCRVRFLLSDLKQLRDGVPAYQIRIPRCSTLAGSHRPKPGLHLPAYASRKECWSRRTQSPHRESHRDPPSTPP